MEFNTKLLHGNFDPENNTGSTTFPIYQSSSFNHNTAEELEAIFKGSQPGFVYSRINNPTIDSLERRIAALEKGIGAIACASGMAAINLALLNILKQGDELVSTSGVFGGTYNLFQGYADLGIQAHYAKDARVESFAAKISDKTRLLFIETIGNPKMDVPDIKALADLAHNHGIPLIVDNTATSPALCRPFELGADIVIHSTSKLINGGGNSIGGIIVDRGKFQWSQEKFPKLQELKSKYGPLTYLAKLRKGFHRDMGPCMSPFNAYLTSLGLETLGLRTERICSNALQLAEFLDHHQEIPWVNYPGLADNPYHNIAKIQFNSQFGIILTFGAGTKERAFKIINSLKYPCNLANIGDIRTLVIHPASTIYATNTDQEKEMMGVTEDMIRVSVGIEDIKDLIEDFDQALKLL